MISYTTKEFYSGTYLQGRTAVISAADFPLYAQKATQRIKQYTGNNVDETATLPDELQMCCCELAEYLFHKGTADQDTEADVKGLSSETTGGHSVSYESAEARERAHNNIIKGIIYNWLAMTGLLYRGC